MSESKISDMTYSAFFWKKKYDELLEQYHTLLHKCYEFYQEENQEHGNHEENHEYGNHDENHEYGNGESDYHNGLYSLFQDKNNHLVKELMNKSLEINHLYKEINKHKIPVSPPPIHPVSSNDMSLNKAIAIPRPHPPHPMPHPRPMPHPMQPKPKPNQPILPNQSKGLYPYYNPYYNQYDPYYNSYYNKYYYPYGYPYYDSYYPYLYRDAKVGVPSTPVPTNPTIPTKPPTHSYKL